MLGQVKGHFPYSVFVSLRHCFSDFQKGTHMTHLAGFRIFAVLTLVFCGLFLYHPLLGAQEPSVLAMDRDGVQRATIQMESYSFTPNSLVAVLGKPVELTLKNESFLVPHNFLLDTPEGERFVEANVSSGETETVRFVPLTPGQYPFYCDKQLLFFPDHREEGMEGVLTVR